MCKLGFQDGEREGGGGGQATSKVKDNLARMSAAEGGRQS